MGTSQKRPILFGLMTIVLVAGMVLLAGCGGGASVHPTATPIPPTATVMPTHPTGPVVTAPISSVTMFSATAGWGVVQANSGSDNQPIAYTVDGGRTWYGVTPAGYSSDRFGFEGLYALSSTEAWTWSALKANNDGSITLWYTADAGAHWTANTVAAGTSAALGNPIAEGVQVDFVDSMHGWLAVTLGAYTSHIPIDVWHTTDGGVTWTKVVRQPIDGHTIGISFVNTSTGFVTAELSPNPEFWINVTHDAGYHWSAVSLPKPGDFQAAWRTDPPIFTSATDGVLVATYGGAQGGKVAVYRTADAGTTWTFIASTRINPTWSTPGAIHTSVTSTGEVVAAITAANGSVALYALPVGASSWTQIQTSSPLLAGLTQLDVVDETHGWAVSTAGLIRTTDGGTTWTVLHAPPSGPFQVTSVSVTVDPSSLAGTKCGTFTVVNYTATFKLAPNGAGGTIQFWYTINNGRGQNGGSVTVAPGQITANYQFEWAGNLPSDHSYPQPGGVLVTSPNEVQSNFVMPSGQCH